MNANISLHLFNSDPVLNGPLPMLPNVIEVGGIHMQPPKKLPDDLQKYIDESQHGVIYFSLGGNMQSRKLSQETRDGILRVFSKLKQRILWKFEEDLPGKPANVETRRWLPQLDILAHPNVRLFITHGGLLSMTETLYYGVPIVGIPVFGDQALNTKNAEDRGFGLSLPLKEFSEEKFAYVVKQVLNNSSYSRTIKRISALLHDQPATPVERAVHWIDHYAVGEGLVRALAAKGHQVTYMTPYSNTTPIKNVKSVHLDQIEKLVKEMISEQNMLESFTIPPILFTFFMADMSIKVGDLVYSDPAVQDVLNGKDTYDAVILEWMMSDYMQGIAYRVKEMISEQNMLESFTIPPILFTFFMADMSIKVGDLVYSDPAVQDVLNGKDTYDAVILEWMMSDYMQGIAYRMQVPSITITTFCPSFSTSYVSGNPSIYSYMPHMLNKSGQKMNFWERITNILLALFDIAFGYLYFKPKQEHLYKYVPEAPSISELNANISLHLFNSDPVINGPLPMLPNVLEVGGIHIINGPLPMLPNVLEVGGIHMKPHKKLPDDLQKFIDESEHGVIYFSLGGNVKSKDIPQWRREEILRVLSKLKQRVLWKFEDDLPGKPKNVETRGNSAYDLPGKPKNVETRKWFPQQDILAHPNVKAFITHGGLLSLTESVYHGLPVLVFGDQDTNMLNAEIRGFGISLPYKEFTEEKFASALDRILNDSSFLETAKKMAALINDQQLTPAEKSVHWIEYVIRHKGLAHLRSVSHDLTWYQYHSLDVILFNSP
ncbi:UDP-glucoronosyl and UDP-glucosyl transferase [Popillia japonica]|uniref:UDP-glucoronosyl and UDP-glucosyl transferase n=1 Tax=Popillia japonica TaxID=7064 RepID=A0AAW1LMK9_POPJA